MECIITTKMLTCSSRYTRYARWASFQYINVIHLNTSGWLKEIYQSGINFRLILSVNVSERKLILFAWPTILFEETIAEKSFPNEKRCIFCCRRKITVTFIAYWKVRPTKCDFAHILEEIAKSFLWWCTNTFHERLLSPIMRWGTM